MKIISIKCNKPKEIRELLRYFKCNRPTEKPTWELLVKCHRFGFIDWKEQILPLWEDIFYSCSRLVGSDYFNGVLRYELSLERRRRKRRSIKKNTPKEYEPSEKWKKSRNKKKGRKTSNKIKNLKTKERMKLMSKEVRKFSLQ